MTTVKYDSKRLRKALIVTAILFAIMLIFSILQWGIASDWGNIRIVRVSFVGEGGSEQSGLMFIPSDVSAENPAPAVINYHGRNNSSYNMINWAMEEARRGYIVLNPDLAGTSETSLAGDNSTENLAISPIEYLSSLDMVSEITVTAHSMGNLSLQAIEQRDEEFEKLTAFVGVGGAFFYNVTGNEFTENTNHMVIEATADLYEYYVMGGTHVVRALCAERSGVGDAMEDGVIYGSIEENNAFEYVEISGTTHQGLLYSPRTIKVLLDFIQLCSPTETALDSTSMIFLGYLCCSAVAFLSFLFFIPALAYTFTSLPGIYSIVNIPLAASKGKPKKKWATHLITDLAIPLALFVPVTNWAKNFPTDFFGSLWVNQIFLWLVACSLIGVALLVFKLVKKSKIEKITPVDFGFGLADEKMFNWKRIGCAVGITIAVTAVCYLWLDIISRVSGLDYQLFSMPGQLVRMTPTRLIYTFRYMLMLIPVYFMIGVNVSTSRRLKDTGNETVDTIKAVLVNILLSAGVLTTLVILQFGSIRFLGDGSSLFSQKYWDSISFGWTFPCMMGLASGAGAFLHRKTGNVWVGMLVTWTMVIAMTVMQCCLVPAANVA